MGQLQTSHGVFAAVRGSSLACEAGDASDVAVSDLAVSDLAVADVAVADVAVADLAVSDLAVADVAVALAADAALDCGGGGRPHQYVTRAYKPAGRRVLVVPRRGPGKLSVHRCHRCHRSHASMPSTLFIHSFIPCRLYALVSMPRTCVHRSSIIGSHDATRDHSHSVSLRNFFFIHTILSFIHSRVVCMLWCPCRAPASIDHRSSIPTMHHAIIRIFRHCAICYYYYYFLCVFELISLY
jgi:hypothetical protein